MDNGTLPSPSPVLVQYQNKPDSDVNKLPDLGKFPYQRRRRGKIDKGKTNGSRMSDVLNADDLGASKLDAPNIDPRLSALNTPAVKQTDQQRIVQDTTSSQETAHQPLQSFLEACEPKTGTSTEPSTSSHNVQTSKPGSSTIWPEHKKMALASVGKQILESAAVNAGKLISVDDIRSILDQNPTYDQLCQTLESRGFVFERAAFARRLLDAVPQTKDKLSTPRTSPGSARKARPTPASDSPRRPRGRPRKDGLPPRRSEGEQSRFRNVTPVVPTSYPDGYVPATNSTSSGLGANKISTAVQDPGDQNLASALQTAIIQIDDQASRQAIKDRPVANTGRPYMTIARPPYTLDKKSEGSIKYTAGEAARNALQWSASRQYSVETFRNENKSDLRTDSIVHSMYRPPPLVNGMHSPYGALNVSGSQVNLGQPDRSKIPQVPSSAEISTPTNPTKEQMARKRNFSEIVDLTQDIDEDEQDAQAQKRARLAQLKSLDSDTGDSDLGTAKQSQFTISTAPEAVTTFNTAMATSQNRTSLISGSTVSANNGRIDLSQFKSSDSGVISSREALRLGEVVKELNKNDALKKSMYNVKTLARDILISKGIHPTEKPLNWHLDSLRGNFRGVTNTSDLSTFRWDLVDPGGPKISRPTREIETKAQDANDEAAKPVQSLVSNPIRGRPRGRPPRSRGAIRGNPSAARSLDAFRSDVTSLVRNMYPSRGGRSFRARGTSHLQTSTTRQSPPPTNFVDISDGTASSQKSHAVGRVPGSTVISLALQSSPSKSVYTGSANNWYQFASERSADMPMVPGMESALKSSLAVRVPRPTPDVAQRGSTIPKRDRPPESTNKSSTSETVPKKRGRPPGSGTPNRGRPSGRGRPVSYRTEVPEDGIGILLPSRSPSTSSHLSHIEAMPEAEKKKKGKRSRQAIAPSFQVFKCQWQGCSSELHNLETLRKHLFKLHGKAESSEGEASFETVQKKIPCLWLDCKHEGFFGSTTGTMKFEDSDSWRDHVEHRHLQTIAWELGDGPSTHPSGIALSHIASFYTCL